MCLHSKALVAGWLQGCNLSEAARSFPDFREIQGQDVPTADQGQANQQEW